MVSNATAIQVLISVPNLQFSDDFVENSISRWLSKSDCKSLGSDIFRSLLATLLLKLRPGCFQTWKSMFDCDKNTRISALNFVEENGLFGNAESVISNSVSTEFNADDVNAALKTLSGSNVKLNGSLMMDLSQRFDRHFEVPGLALKLSRSCHFLWAKRVAEIVSNEDCYTLKTRLHLCQSIRDRSELLLTNDKDKVKSLLWYSLLNFCGDDSELEILETLDGIHQRLTSSSSALAVSLLRSGFIDILFSQQMSSDLLLCAVVTSHPPGNTDKVCVTVL